MSRTWQNGSLNEDTLWRSIPVFFSFFLIKNKKEDWLVSIENEEEMCWLWTSYVVLVYHSHPCYWKHSGSSFSKEGRQKSSFRNVSTDVSTDNRFWECFPLYIEGIFFPTNCTGILDLKKTPGGFSSCFSLTLYWLFILTPRKSLTIL